MVFYSKVVYDLNLLLTPLKILMHYPIEPNEDFRKVHGHQYIRNKATNADELFAQITKEIKPSDFEIVYQCEGDFQKISKSVPKCEEKNCVDPPNYNPGGLCQNICPSLFLTIISNIH